MASDNGLTKSSKKDDNTHVAFKEKGCNNSSKSSSSSTSSSTSCSTSSSTSSSSSSSSCKPCSSGRYKGKCADYKITCWPVCPKDICPPCDFDYDTIKHIPNGSLIFIARNGPFSELNAQVTGVPYDLMGIVLQSENNCKSSTYVYTVDTFLQKEVEKPKIMSKITLINLKKLMSDPCIIAISVRILKGFHTDECDSSDYIVKTKPQWRADRKIGRDFRPGNAYEAIDALNNAYRAGKYNSSTSCSRPYIPKHKGSSSSSTCSSSSSSSSSSCSTSSSSCSRSDCDFSSYSSSIHSSKHWCRKLAKHRVNLLRKYLKEYTCDGGEHDSYQTMASIYGLPVAEEYRTKSAFTSPELCFEILWRVGLVWDDRLTCNGR